MKRWGQFGMRLGGSSLFDPLHRKLNDGVGNSDDTDEDYRVKVSIIRNRKRQSEEVFSSCAGFGKIILFLTEKHQTVISIGGDGIAIGLSQYVPVGSGAICWRPYWTPGFYTIQTVKIDKLVENLKYDTGAKVSYPILNVRLLFNGGNPVPQEA